MRLHSSVITLQDVYRAGQVDTACTVDATQRGSKSRARSFDVALTAFDEPGRRVRNFGTSGGSWGSTEYDKAATWDEWGIFLARLFALDPDMIAGTAKHPNYADAADFGWRTDWRYGDGSEGFASMPDHVDMHHNWIVGEPYIQRCSHKGCSAIRRWDRQPVSSES